MSVETGDRDVRYAADPVERESVGAFRAIAEMIRSSARGSIVWSDPAGGAASARIASVSSIG